MLIGTAAIAIFFLASAVVGDVTVGATVAGVFSILNTFLLASVSRRQKDVRRVLTAPRRLVYDAQGRPVGTILDLEAPPSSFTVQAARRHTDDDVDLPGY